MNSTVLTDVERPHFISKYLSLQFTVSFRDRGNNTALALATIIPPACPITLKMFIWKPSSDHKATCAFLFTGVYIFNHMGRDLSHALTHGYVYKQ